jgi:hypothetical protein
MFDTHDIENLIIYKKPPGNPALRSRNEEYINEYISAAQYLKGPVRAIRLRKENLKTEATKLILLLKKEYGIE